MRFHDEGGEGVPGPFEERTRLDSRRDRGARSESTQGQLAGQGQDLQVQAVRVCVSHQGRLLEPHQVKRLFNVWAKK